MERQLLTEDATPGRAPRGLHRPASGTLIRLLLAFAGCWLVVCVMLVAGMVTAAFWLIATGPLLAVLWRLSHLDVSSMKRRG
jgi:hypothetical protein